MAKKSTKKKTTKKSTKKASTSKGDGKTPPTKTEIYRHISDKTGLTRKDVGAVFDELTNLAAKNLKRSGPGEFTVPGLCKVVVKKKPATKARKGVPNPFRPGETMDIAAKPARKTVKVRPLKKLKDMV